MECRCSLSPSNISRAVRETIPPEERNVSSITRFYRRLYGTVSLPRRGRIQMLLSSLIFALAAQVGGAKGYPVQSDAFSPSATLNDLHSCWRSIREFSPVHQTRITARR